MKIGNLFRFAFASLYRRKRFLLIELIMITISLCLVNHGFIRYYDVNRSIIKLKENIDSELENTYKVTFGTMGNVNNVNGESMYRFVESLKNIDGIKTSGKFYIEGLGMRQYGQDNIQLYGMDLLLMDEDILNIKQLYNISDEKIHLKKGEYVPLILGYNYKDIIPIGTKLTDTYYGRNYIVVDVLRQGETWLSSPILQEGIYEMNLDDMCISICEEEEIFIQDGWFTCFVFANNVYAILDVQNKEETLKNIMQVAEQENIAILVQSIPELIQEHRDMYSKVYSETNFQVILLCGMTLIGLLMTMFISLKLQSNNMKIMYVYGVSKVEHVKIHIISQIIIYVFAFLLSQRISYDTTADWYGKDVNYVEEISVYSGMMAIVMFTFVEIIAITAIYNLLSKTTRKGD